MIADAKLIDIFPKRPCPLLCVFFESTGWDWFAVGVLDKNDFAVISNLEQVLESTAVHSAILRVSRTEVSGEGGSLSV